MGHLSCFLPGDIWPDTDGVHINAHGGGVLQHEGRYYWFGEHKVGGSVGNSAQVGVGVYSSSDLYNWKNEGIALSVSEEHGDPIQRGCILERPKVIFNDRTKRFVMWFHLEPLGAGYGGAQSGVAVADCVTGPYRLVGNFRPNAGHWPENLPIAQRLPLDELEAGRLRGMNLNGGPVEEFPDELICRRDFAGGQMARDMTLFVDDDGSAYHIYASEENGTLHISLLSEDYTRCSGRYVRALVGRFHEAPAVFKRGGKYFLITSGCTGWAPNAARLSVAEAMFGTWTEVGNPCVGTVEEVRNTFESQSTFVLRAADQESGFIFMADRWRPKDAIQGRYVWLPLEFRHGVSVVGWREKWDLTAFAK